MKWPYFVNMGFHLTLVCVYSDLWIIPDNMVIHTRMLITPH